MSWVAGLLVVLIIIIATPVAERQARLKAIMLAWFFTSLLAGLVAWVLIVGVPLWKEREEEQRAIAEKLAAEDERVHAAERELARKRSDEQQAIAKRAAATQAKTDAERAAILQKYGRKPAQ